MILPHIIGHQQIEHDLLLPFDIVLWCWSWNMVNFLLFPGPLAQLVEQLTFNQWVAGSIPARPTTLTPTKTTLF